MPLLDVTEVLSDPDFATTILVARTAETIAVGGFTQLVPAIPVSVSAVVEPATSDDLDRMPQAETATGNIAIWTTYRLSAAGPGMTADLVTWRGRNYTIHVIDDWTEFGAGYIRALAGLTSLI